MLTQLSKTTICKKQRLFFTCPNCEKIVVLDMEVFKEDPREICCEACKSKYMVISLLSDDKRGLSMHIIKQGK
jgi:hypothetical protein